MTPEHKTELIWTLALAGVLVVVTVLIIITGIHGIGGELQCNAAGVAVRGQRTDELCEI